MTMAVLLVAVCFLAYSWAANSAVSFIETDSIVFPGDNTNTNTNISDKLKECIEDNFKIAFNGECRTLLTTEYVCPDNYWLVLDLTSASLPKPVIRGKCAQRKCPPKQHYWAPLNRCVYPNASTTLCPRGNILRTDYFGDGFCECEREPVHGMDRNGVCYPLFTRGPCAADTVWVRVNERMSCSTDNCSALRRQSPNKIIVPWKDNKCYAINERGPCKQGDVVITNTWTFKPECQDPLTPLQLLTPGCTATDHSGKCTPSVHTPQDTFLNQIKQQAGNKRTRKSEQPK